MAMGPKDVIAKTLDMSDFIMNKYLDDLSDADLRLEAVEGMHPIALQLGHLICPSGGWSRWSHPASRPRFRPGFDDTARHQEAARPTAAGF